MLKGQFCNHSFRGTELRWKFYLLSFHNIHRTLRPFNLWPFRSASIIIVINLVVESQRQHQYFWHFDQLQQSSSANHHNQSVKEIMAPVPESQHQHQYFWLQSLGCWCGPPAHICTLVILIAIIVFMLIVISVLIMTMIMTMTSKMMVMKLKTMMMMMT